MSLSRRGSDTGQPEITNPSNRSFVSTNNESMQENNSSLANAPQFCEEPDSPEQDRDNKFYKTFKKISSTEKGRNKKPVDLTLRTNYDKEDDVPQIEQLQIYPQ